MLLLTWAIMKLETLTAAASSVILSHQSWFEFPCAFEVWLPFARSIWLFWYSNFGMWWYWLPTFILLFHLVFVFMGDKQIILFLSNAVWFLYSLVLGPWIFPMFLLWSECACTLKFICWNISPNEGSVLMNRITVPTEDTWGSLLASSAIRGHSKKVPFLKKGLSLDTKSVGALTLDFQFPELWAINFYGYELPSLRYHVI